MTAPLRMGTAEKVPGGGGGGGGMRLLLAALLAVVLASLPGCASPLTLSHWDLEGANVTCDDKSTCASQATTPASGRFSRMETASELVDWRERNCMCDPGCAHHGDCCVDSEHFVASEQRRGAATFECVSLRRFGGVYMRTSCPPSWEDGQSRALCEARDRLSAVDPVGGMPVTSRRTAITYRNAHCALCHGDVQDVVVWNAHLECSGLLQQQANLSSSAAASCVAFDEASSRWGLNLTDAGFQPCDVDPYLPDAAGHLVRRCDPDIVRACAVNWTNAEVRLRCEAYTAHVFRGSDGYRNPHCAVCNNVPVQYLACSRAVTRSLFHKDFTPGAFAVIFDLGGSDPVGLTSPCESENELYDPFFQQCRFVVCTGHREYYHGECIAVQVEDSSEEDDWVGSGGGNHSYALKDEEGSTLGPEAFNHSQWFHPEGAGGNHTSGPRYITDLRANFSQEFLTCPKFVLQPDEYVLGPENGSVTVPLYGLTFSSTEYLRHPDGMLEICATVGRRYLPKFGPYMGYVTLAGLGVSVVFLVLHLAAFAALPELRNLSGKNLASLCVALLCGYIAFIASQMIPTGPTAGCVSAAAVVQYSFLAAFCWTLAMAFDVWRTLRLATSELRVSSGKQWRKFAAYSAFCWAAPMLSVVVALAADAAPEGGWPDELRPAFGVYTCWFGHRHALLVFFALPLAVVMVCNVAFFVSSARIIFATTSTTRFTSSGGGARRDFRLYVRLAIVMGLTWSVGLLAGYLDQEGLWYAFVALNTLQGLFIFLAFTCTEKVARAIVDAACSRRRKVSPVCAGGASSSSLGGGGGGCGGGGGRAGLAAASLSWSGSGDSSDATRNTHVATPTHSSDNSDTLY
ncbi:uncharacterized protein LOC126334620 [Schistocerca gregaria]|uniref:uncharacterized protein LOC126334620 n=1 Tax=Schistocerca gregaria TaxID=7010 RepID=UPI00211EAF99|nr:uncharacterized protein LOC126334620 [Schistocerca gregaria]